MSSTGIVERRVQLSRRRWEAGDYEIVVADSARGRLRGKLRMVSEAAPRPVELDALEPTPGRDPLRATVRSAWLSTRGEGEWRLEAYQTASEYAASFKPAALLRSALEQDRKPPPPPVRVESQTSH